MSSARLRARTPEPARQAHPSAAQAPAAPRRRKGHEGHEGHGEKRLPWALGAGEGSRSPLGQTCHRGRGGAEGKRRWFGLFFLAVTSLPPSLPPSLPRLLPFTLSTHPLSCPRSRLSSFSPDNLSIVITITSTQCFQQRAGCSRRGGHLPFAFIALSRVTD